jgi:1,4-alpha-glucan branching enzyme
MTTTLKDTKKQVFRITAPDAQSVLLVGDFTQWQKKAIPLQREPGGVWTTSVALPPGKHTYRFLIDGDWRDDPECTVRVPNPFGTEDMVREAA